MHWNFSTQARIGKAAELRNSSFSRTRSSS
jgi:hypothetical protein